MVCGENRTVDEKDKCRDMGGRRRNSKGSLKGRITKHHHMPDCAGKGTEYIRKEVLQPGLILQGESGR